MKIPISTLLAQKDPIVRSIHPTATVQDGVAIMAAYKIGCVLIVEENRLIGIFTEHDVITRVIVPGIDHRTTPISRVMTPEPFTVDPSLALDKAMALISEKRMRHLPVVEDGRLVGLVSIGDLNKWMVEHLRYEAATLRSYVAGEYPG